jgi:hypothetical protein
MFKRIVAMCLRHREWIAIVIASGLLILAFKIIPTLDARSGIDGFGDLYFALMMVVKGLLAVSLAWACKAHFWYEIENGDEYRCARLIEDDVSWGALVTIAIDRLSWVAWLGWWSWVIFQH